MDRFIVYWLSAVGFVFPNLKSNMDRFIEVVGRALSYAVYPFKIQYG